MSRRKRLNVSICAYLFRIAITLHYLLIKDTFMAEYTSKNPSHVDSVLSDEVWYYLQCAIVRHLHHVRKNNL